MARAVPMLPCGPLDETVDFYRALGFEVMARQERPYSYAALRREDIDLHVYGMPDWDPEQSHSTCLIVVDDTEALWAAWAAGLRARYGRVPLTGLPRMTRPRRRANADGASGFSVVDPNGNWIRVFPDRVTEAQEPTSTLSRAVENAVVQADSRGDTAQALKMLAGAERRAPADTPSRDRLAALALLAELQVRVGAPDDARATLARLETIPVEDGPDVAVVLEQARELARDLSG
ncbi:VOC family protein [uncultured Cellulomonas sp.]|uniref:VOC family protein n=1 Tax=uncultured Cellulomonas sp. TaxID=189682 RepID=UPI0028E888B2|nr:VOC family protein [uncultured Cellulomonas sp.]